MTESDLSAAWRGIVTGKEDRRRNLEALPAVEKLRLLDQLAARRAEIRAATRPWSDAEVDRVVARRLADAAVREAQGVHRASLERRALDLLASRVMDLGAVQVAWGDLAPRDRNVATLLWLWFRHHDRLLREPQMGALQPREPFRARPGSSLARLNCDREFWAVLRFVESTEGLWTPLEYLGHIKGFDFTLRDAGGVEWRIEVTEATERGKPDVDAALALDGVLHTSVGPWAGDQPEQVLAELIARTVRRKRSKVAPRLQEDGVPAGPVGLLICPNVDELIGLDEGSWNVIVDLARRKLDEPGEAEMFTAVWIVPDLEPSLKLFGNA